MTFRTKLAFKLSFVFKLISILAVVFLLFWMGGIYVHYQIKQWLKEEMATIEIDSWRPSLNGFLSPSLVIGRTVIEFKNPQTSLEKLEFSKAIIELDIISTLKHFMFPGIFPVKMQGLKVDFKDQTYIKSEKIGGRIAKKWNSYEFDNISVEPFQFGVFEYQPENKRYQLDHLVIYRIKGKLNYQIKSQLIRLLLEIPEASLQIPEGKGYSLKAEGELQLLEQKDAPVPVQGKINLEIKQLFNLLSYFHPIGIISSVEKNLDAIQGKSSAVEGFSLNHIKEEKEENITLKVKFQPNAIYVGPLKVYP